MRALLSDCFAIALRGNVQSSSVESRLPIPMARRRPQRPRKKTTNGVTTATNTETTPPTNGKKTVVTYGEEGQTMGEAVTAGVIRGR